MVKRFSNAEIKKQLEKLDFLLPRGYGAGIPVYLKSGIKVIQSFNELFARTIEKNFDFHYLNPDYIIPKENVANLYKFINDYSGELVAYKDNYILSDALFWTLEEIKRVAKQGTRNYSLFTLSSLYREKVNSLIPLYKDKNIYPVIQLDQLIHSDNYEQNLSKLKKMYKEFYKLLGIEILFLEAREVPHYAQYELYFLAADGEKYTKLGMIYELSSQFKVNLGLTSPSIRLMNSGFSGKSLFLSIKNHSEANNFFSIPLCVLNDWVYISVVKGFSARRAQSLFLRKNIRCTVSINNNKSFRKWKRSPTPFYLLIHEHFTLYTKKGDILQFFDIKSTVDYICKKIRLLKTIPLEHSKKSVKSNLSHLKKDLCIDCWASEYYGLIHLDNTSQCLKCGKNINKSLFITDSSRRFY